ncbi:MAG: hypothetical protein KUG83_09615 [Gammaproteobacteria bacterium]|nr:hypothetical protein [Gammaproteobacteria bacterium]
MNKVKVMRVGGLLALICMLPACVAQMSPGGTTVGVGCTEDFVTYKKELRHLIEEGEDEAASKRLEEIIEYVECDEEPESK